MTSFTKALKQLTTRLARTIRIRIGIRIVVDDVYHDEAYDDADNCHYSAA